MDAYTKDFKPYFDNYPFMSRLPNGELDGNAILYAGTYGLLYRKLFGIYLKAPEHSTHLYFESYLRDQPGVITRGPHKWKDTQTHDDYIGLASLSFFGTMGAATAIYNYGKRNNWNYSRKDKPFNFFDWFDAQFWRIPGVVQHIKMCAGMRLNFIDSALWALGILTTRINNASGIILNWHMISVYEESNEKNWLCDCAVRQFKEKLIAKYPGAMGDVFKIYYGSHPFSKWALGIF